ncbi:MAG: hypothetical protein LBC85_10245 [Fibromonadaceae bacterium]|jgi:hypothetical protein|nr:hypothetical protein [Fibromonadaceae bacterium]
MNKQKIALVIACGVGILAVFMPWASFPIMGTFNGMKAGSENIAVGIGGLNILFLAVALLIALVGNKTKSLGSKIKYIAASAGLISITIIVYFAVSFNQQIGSIGIPCEDFFGLGRNVTQAVTASISIEFGLYLAIIAGIGVYLISLFPNWFGDESDKITSKPKMIFLIVSLVVLLVTSLMASGMSPKAKATEIEAAAKVWLKLQEAYSMETMRFGSNKEIGYTSPQSSNSFCYESGITSANTAVWKATARGSLGNCKDGVWIITMTYNSRSSETKIETKITGANCEELTPNFKNLK